MIKKSLIGVVVVLFLVTFISFISASVVFGEGNGSHSLGSYYGPGEPIIGWVNISVNDEATSSVISDNLGNSIDLISLLKNDSTFTFDCVPIDCESSYVATAPLTTKTLEIKAGKTAYLGFKFTGTVNSVNSVNFDLVSDVTSSCFNQLKIDILGDGQTDLGNTKSTTATCDSKKNYGCFSDTKPFEDYTINTNVPYCEQINLKESPSFRLGAYLKKKTGSKNLSIGLYNEYGEPVKDANCILPYPTTTGGEVYCDINFLVTEPRDYYVCILPDDKSVGETQLRGYEDSNGCGFHNYPVQIPNAAYKIFAEGKKFAPIGTLNINDSTTKVDTISGVISDYLALRYGSPSVCPSNGCVVPIKFTSTLDQTVTLKNLEIDYSKGAGDVSDDKFYDVSATPAKISSDNFQKLYIDSLLFLTPTEFGNKTIKWNLNSNEIFSFNLSVEKVPIISGLSPLRTVSGYPTDFVIKLDTQNISISSYSWKFPEGVKTTTTNKTTYTFNQTGTYTIGVNVTDVNGRVSFREFSVEVSSPNTTILAILTKEQADLTNIKSQIAKYPKFYMDTLNEALNIESLENQLTDYQRKYDTASRESDYLEIMKTILDFDIPSSISVQSEADSFLFFPQREVINLDDIATATGGTYEASKQDKYIDALYGWQQENIAVHLNYKSFVVKTSKAIEPVYSFYEITVEEKSDMFGVKAVLGKMDGLVFEEKYNVDDSNPSFFTIPITDTTTSFKFATTSSADFADIPLVVSPSLSELTIDDPYVPPFKPKSHLVMIILIILFLIILFIVGYILLQIWYKKKYEAHLFSNRNDLFNIVSFVESSKRKGLSNSGIKVKLKKSGWNGEQITYALRKYAGKRTGMIEIPFENFIGMFHRAKKEEKAKKNLSAPSQSNLKFSGNRNFGRKLRR